MTDIEAIYEAQRVESGGLKKGENYFCGCGESHEVNDPECVLLFEHKPWHVDCLVDFLGDYYLGIKKILRDPGEALDIAPLTSANGIVWCSRSKDCNGYSKLANGDHFCTRVGAKVTEHKPCMVWLASLMKHLRSWD